MKRPQPHHRPPRRPTALELEELEPRLLFSADPAALLGLPVAAPLAPEPQAAAAAACAAPATGVTETAASQAPQAVTAASPSATSGPEVAFVDMGVENARALLDALKAQQAAGRDLQIVEIGGDEDGIAVITRTLAALKDVQAVHVLSHGDAEGLQIGSSRLDADHLAQRMGEISAWSQSMASEGDLLLYGCNLASSTAGRALIGDLSLLSGADVAASDDLTGATRLGGDWTLEFQQGRIDDSRVLQAAAMANFDQVLATLTLRDGLNGYTGTEDTYIYTNMGVAQNVNQGASTTLAAGEDGTGGQAQLLLKFTNLVGYGANQIPPGSTINTVTLTIFVLDKPTFTSPSFGINRMLVNWSDAATWDSMGDGITTFFPSEARGTSDQTIATGSDNQSRTFASNANMVASVQAWVNDPSTNHGWYMDNGDYSARTTFASSENGTVANRPTLTITYTPAAPNITSNGGGATAAVSVAENQTAVTTVVASGGLAPLTYSISGGTDAARFSIDASTGVLTFNAPPNYEAPTDSDANNTYQVTVATTDGTTTDTQTITVTVTNVNDVAPVVSATGSSLSYTENAGAVAVDSLLTVSDADSTTLSGATVQITGNYVASEDLLGFTSQNGITATWDAAQGLLTLSGTASVANYQAALRSITYTNSSDNPSTATRTISAKVNDGGFNSNTVTRNITITSVNDAPVITSNGGGANGAVSVAEGSTSVTTVVSTDAEGTTRTYTIVGGADAARFSLDSATGVLTFLSAPDYEAPTDSGGNNVYDVIVQASDGVLADTQTLAITVTDIDEFDIGAVTDTNAAANSVAENAANGSTVGLTARATDADGSNNTVTYSLSNNAGGRFAINATTGVVTVANGTLLSYETATSHSITVLATSADGSTSSQSFTINLTDVDEFDVGAVSDTNAVTNSVAENAANGTTVGITARATDADATNNTVTYSLSNNAGGRFAINATTGVVTVADGTLLNYESATSHGITVLATSADGSTSSQSFTINLTDVDEFDVGAVTDTNATANSVAENAANGSAVGITARATDADATNNTVTYSLSNNAGGRFAINAATGVVTVANGTLLNYETATSHSITVLATSADGSTSSQSFTINLTDVDEFDVGAVTDTDAAANSVAENAANGTAVGVTARATDADGSNNTVTYSLSNNAGGRFAINAATGVVTVANGTLLNYETATSHSITVLTTSADGSTSSQSFTINLTDVDEFDVGAVSDSNASANSVTENAANGTAVGVTALATDLDATNNAVTYSLTDNAGGRFTINAATGVVTVADGSLLDFESATSHSITVLATSADGSTSSQSFLIGVADADEYNVGSVSDIDAASNTVAENAANGSAVGITALGVDADGSNNTVTYTLTDSAGGRFAINAATGVVTVADGTLLDMESATSHSITVLATSADGSTSSQSFTINLTDVDDGDVGAVTDADGAANAVAENAGNGVAVGITAQAVDPDVTNNTVTYSLSDSAGGRFAINATTGVVTVANRSLLDYETSTSHSITVVATSSDGSTSSQTFVINITDASEAGVTAVDDTNAAADQVSENAANGSTVGVTAHAVDPDPGDTVSYSLSDNAGGRFTINAATGVVTVANGSLLDREAAASHAITIVATSTDGSTATYTCTITLLDVDEFNVGAVTDTNAAANVLAENSANGTAVGITASASDADATTNTITYSLSNNAGGRFTINAATGVVTVANGTLLNYESASSHSITVLATSADGSTSSQSFTINLTDVDEFDVGAISDNNAAANSVAENAANGSTVGVTARATDADGSNNTITYTLTNNAGGRFAINAATGVVTVANGTLLNREAAASHVITVRAASSDGSSRTQNFTINVTDVDEFDVGAVTDANAAANAVAENAANGTAVGITASAADLDATTNAITYTLADSAGGRFAIHATTGVVTVADGSLLNHEAAASHSITVLATSADGSTSSQSFTVNLTDVDEFDVGAITDADGQADRVAENAANGTAVGITAQATDLDATNNTVSYALFDDAGGRFAIDAVTGVVTVADGSLLDREAAASHQIIVLATSADGSTSSHTYTVNLADVDEFDIGGVTDVDPATSVIPENAANGATVGITARATDADATTNTITYTLSNSAGGRFTIDATTGVVTVANSALLNYEAATSHSITVLATSADGSTSSQSFTINLSDVNEFAVGAVTDTNAAANGVAENAANGSSVGITARATDADGTNNAVTYSLSNSAGGRFTIDATTGVVTVADGTLLNHEAATTHSITVLATSADGSTSSLSFTINLTDVNEFAVGAVTDTNAAANTVAENAANGTSVGITARATDADATNNTVTYSLSNSAGGRFTIDATTGVVTVANGTLLNYEAAPSHSITVLATSADGSTSSQSFTINLTDINEFGVGAVTDTNAAANSVAENAANGSSVGITARATDADGTNNTVTYSLSNSAGGRFTIDATTGLVTVANGTLLNHEAAASHSITVLATSADGSTSSQSFTINLTDVNEFSVDAVTDTNAAANSVAENAANGTSVGITARATDADATNNAVTYSLTNSAGGRFTIDATTGVVTVANGTLLNHEAASSHGITVLATSADGSTSSQSFTINLTDVNEFAVGAVTDTNAAANSVAENAANGTAVGATAHATDADATTNSVTYALTDSAGGRFAIDAITGVITVADGSRLDFESAASHAVTVLATSADGSSSSLVITIAVTNVNEAPSLAVSGTLAATEQVPVSLDAFGATTFDPDGDPLRLTVTATAGVLAFDPGTTGVTVTGAGSGSVTLSGTASQLNAALAGLQGAALTYLADMDNPPATVTLTWTLQDVPAGGTALATTRTTSLAVAGVHDAPVSVDDNRSTVQDVPLSLSEQDLLANDRSPEGAPLAMVLLQGPQHGTLTRTPGGGWLYTPAAGYVGADSFTYQVDDGTAQGNVASVSIDVQPAPQVPLPPTPVPGGTGGTGGAGGTGAPGSGSGSGSDTGTGTTQPDRTQDTDGSQAGGPGTGAAPSGDESAGRDDDDLLAVGRAQDGDAAAAAARRASDALSRGMVLRSEGPGWQPPVFQPVLLVGQKVDAEGAGLLLTPTWTAVSDASLRFSAASLSALLKDDEARLPALVQLTPEALQTAGSILSIGAVWWAARGAALLTSLLVSTPVWRSMDPLPVLSAPRTSDDDEDDDGDSSQAEMMFDEHAPPEDSLIA